MSSFVLHGVLKSESLSSSFEFERRSGWEPFRRFVSDRRKSSSILRSTGSFCSSFLSFGSSLSGINGVGRGTGGVAFAASIVVDIVAKGGGCDGCGKDVVTGSTIKPGGSRTQELTSRGPENEDIFSVFRFVV